MCTFLLSYVWPGRTFSEQLLVSTGCCSVLDIRYIHIHRYKTLSIYHHIAQKVITFYSLFTIHFASTLDLDHVLFLLVAYTIHVQYFSPIVIFFLLGFIIACLQKMCYIVMLFHCFSISFYLGGLTKGLITSECVS
uniref:(northern house mosquito) hypothetical protein n=1 Tax=Culex pipiens TaxID=7175 RepID=A0A8D8FXX7_CULPI